MADEPTSRVPGADRWQRVEDLFSRAADLPPADRGAFLDAECRTADGVPDPVLRAEVEALIQHDVQARAFFDDANARLAAVADGIGDEREAAPERVGPWRLVERVGQGGMGTVWRAERADGRFEQTAAVKLVRAGLADDLTARFRAERQILARLDHPAIARLLDGGLSDDGRPYLVMEFVDGVPLTDFCDRHRLGVDARLGLFRQVCQAVQFAHRQLVVHRDLKPSNILVAGTADAPQVKLLDFGIAKLLAPDAALSLVETATEQRVMTPEYAAPEQVRGEPVTTATDVYALGVLLYELLTGGRPYRLESRARHAVERAILDADPTVPSTAVTDADAHARASEPTRLRRRLRGDLDQIVLRALRKEPERRYDGAAALSADLKRHLDGLPVEARPESVSYRVGKFVRRHRAATAAAAVALLAVVGGAGVALWQASQARAAQALAEAEAERATGTTDFFNEILFAAAPINSLGDTLTVWDAVERAEADLDSVLAGDPATRAAVLQNLAAAYTATGDFERAEALHARAAAALDEIEGDRRAVEAAVLQSRGVTAWYQGEMDGIEPIFRRSYELTRSLYGDDHVNTAYSLNDLALVVGALGRTDESLAMHEDAIRVAEREVGPDDMDLIRLKGNFAATLWSAGRGAESRAWSENTIASFERVHGDGAHPDLSNYLQSYGFTLLGLGEPARAEAAFRRALSMRERLGTGEDDVAGSQTGLARALHEQGRHQDAIRTARSSADVLRGDGFRADAPAPSMTIEGDALLALGRTDDAVRVLREALRLGRETRPEHGNTYEAAASLGAALAAAGEREDARALLREAVDGLADMPGRAWMRDRAAARLRDLARRTS